MKALDAAACGVEGSLPADGAEAIASTEGGRLRAPPFFSFRKLVAIPLLAALATPALAAPHLTGSKPEPAHARARDRLTAASIAALRAPALAGVPAQVRILLLRVDFPPDDVPSTTGTGEWSDPSYGHLGDPDYWVSRDASRFASYYAEVSYGRLAVDVTAMPPAPAVYRLPYTMAHYGDESDAALEDLVYDSVTAASQDPTNAVTDFTPYDAVLIVHAGAGEETDVNLDSASDLWSLFYSAGSGAIRSSETGLALTQTLRDGNPIGEAIVMPQTSEQDDVAADPLGVYVHEFGHWLGLPDLYCTAVLCMPDGVGQWSVMGDGMYNRVRDEPFGSSPAHLDAWSKAFLGWVTPVEPSPADPGAVVLPAAETEPAVYRLPVSGDPSAGAQYFLVENRQSIGYDAGLPGHGLLVWLVDEAIIGSTSCSSGSASRFCTNTVNNSPVRPGIKLVEADADGALQKAGCAGAGIDCGNAGDPFPGTGNVVRLTPTTTPSTSGYSGWPWLNLRDMAEDVQTGDVSLSIGFAPVPPQGVTADASGTVSWTVAPAGDDPDPAVAFNVYREGVLATPAPLTAASYGDPAPARGVSYQVTAIDAAGNESEPSPALVPQAATSDSRCFIATAAYGSALDPSVAALRAFRDRHLLTNAFGRAFVALYYRWSPGAADFIRRHEAARRAARWTLAPIVAAVEHPVLSWACAICAAFVILAVRPLLRDRHR